MKFSIKFLMALIVLGAFLTNYFLVHQEKHQIQAELLDTIAESDSLIFAERKASEFIPLYLRAIEGEKLLNGKYQAAFDANKNLPYIVSELKIENPDLISFCALPLIKSDKFNHIAFRIYVPESQPVFLKTEFENEESAFETTGPHSVQLVPGHHVVDYRFDFSDTDLLELYVDDKKMFSVKTLGAVSNGYSLSRLGSGQTEIRSLSEQKKMFRFTPSFKNTEPNTNGRARMVVYLKGGTDEE